MRGGGKLTRKPSLPPKSSEAKPHETPTTPVWKPPLPNPPSEAEQAKKEDTPTTGFNQPVSGWKVGCVVVSTVGIITLIYCCFSMSSPPQSTYSSPGSSVATSGISVLNHRMDFVKEHIDQLGETVYEYKISGTVRNNSAAAQTVRLSAYIYNDQGKMIEGEGCTCTVPGNGTATFSFPDWGGELAKVSEDQQEIFYLTEYPARYEVSLTTP
jgi:hypothetical protein